MVFNHFWEFLQNGQNNNNTLLLIDVTICIKQ